MDRRMHEWVDGFMDVWVAGYMPVGMHGWMHVCTLRELRINIHKLMCLVRVHIYLIADAPGICSHLPTSRASSSVVAPSRSHPHFWSTS